MPPRCRQESGPVFLSFVGSRPKRHRPYRQNRQRAHQSRVGYAQRAFRGGDRLSSDYCRCAPGITRKLVPTADSLEIPVAQGHESGTTHAAHRDERAAARGELQLAADAKLGYSGAARAAPQPPHRRTSTRTRVRPARMKPSPSAAARDRSMMTPSPRGPRVGPRSTIRTSTDRPFFRFRTRTTVPKGYVG
jgi:hypothetical protein